jgi:ribosomal protein S18 acetylase RimI-like enzyme
MIEIDTIAVNDLVKFEIVRQIAQDTWPVTYGDILTQEQIDYMFDMMYSVPSLLEQGQTKNHQFILAKEGNVYLGFASYEINANSTYTTKIHKIYILPSAQRRGIGKTLIDYIANAAQKQRNTAISLNVNKYNPAQHFYARIGFSIAYEEIIDIGKNYVMDDYVMQKPL